MGSALIILGLVFVILRAMMIGYIAPSTGAIILGISIFLIAASRKMLLTLLVLFLPIYLFAREYGIGPRSFVSLMFNLLPLLIMLYGLYLIFRGLFQRR